MYGHILKAVSPIVNETFSSKGDNFLKSGVFISTFEFNKAPKDLIDKDSEGGVLDNLSFLTNSITMPDISINNVQFKTIKYFNINVPGKVDYGGQYLTIKFYETTDGLVFKFLANWFNYLRPTLGINKKLDVRRESIKANLLVAVLDRTLRKIPFACIFVGLYPTKLPTESFAPDIFSRNIIFIDAQFTYDTVIISDEVYKQAEKLLNSALDIISNRLYPDFKLRQ